MEFRESEEKRLNGNPDLMIGDVSIINITAINGGIQQNVIPPEVTMNISARLSVNVDEEKFESNVREWCKEAGTDIDVSFDKMPRIEPTKLNESNVYWMAFKDVFENDL